MVSKLGQECTAGLAEREGKKTLDKMRDEEMLRQNDAHGGSERNTRAEKQPSPGGWTYQIITRSRPPPRKADIDPIPAADENQEPSMGGIAESRTMNVRMVVKVNTSEFTW